MVRRSWSGLIAGGWGGSLVGLGEAGFVVAMGASLSEFGLFPFGFWSYACLGALLGAVVGLGVSLWGRGENTAVGRNWLGTVAGLTVATLGFVVGRYHLAQRLFAEQFPGLTSVEGAAWHLALALGAVVAGTAGGAAVYALTGRNGREAGLLGLWVVAFAATWAGTLALRPEELRPQRRAFAPGDKPNVVLIVVDTLRADALGFVTQRARTPSIDAFARDSVWFRHAYAQSSWTRPSVATILTGLYPQQHGARQKFDPLPDRVDTLAEVLRDAGYWTAAFVTNINVVPIFNFHQGFQEYHYLSPSFYFGASDSATRLSAYKLLRLLRERFFRRRLYVYHYYQDAAVVTERVRSWLAEAPPQPFFLLLHYMDPHDPYFEMPYNGRGIARVLDPDPPAERAAEMHRLYLRGVEYFDEHFGQLVAAFRERGLLERTLFVFTADHGEEFHEHGGWWHGTTLYEEQIRVPLLVRRPDNVGAGHERTDFARTLDIMPTILGQVGVDPPRPLPGRDLFIDGPSPEELYAEESLEGNQLETLRWQQWKLIVANAGNPRGLPEVELFDLSVDPGEHNNVAEARPEVVREMRARLERVRAGLSVPALR